jgi:PIN domain nuclease of toxin-antitoxin system
MTLLLVTHIWLWMNLEPSRIPARYARAMADPNLPLALAP